MSCSLRLLKPSHFLATAGGVGLFPVAPGTVGSLVAVPLYLASCDLPWTAQLAFVAVSYLAGVWAAGQTEKALGRTDPSLVVWDEVVGFWVALLLTPADWRFQVAAFAAFRLLDVVKPWPISVVQRRVKGGQGIMLDDLLAGLAAGLLIYFIKQYITSIS